MEKPEHEYWAVGQSIRLCNWTTGHTVRDVAFCHTPECAAVFAKMLNEHQIMKANAQAEIGSLCDEAFRVAQADERAAIGQ